MTSPALLHDEIRSKYCQFRGYSQQDAHELCLSLISCLRDEEIQAQRSAFCQKYRVDRKNPTAQDKAKVQRFKHSLSHTPVDSVFCGQLVCWVKCCDCSHVSFHMERFNDLSLSIPGDHNSSMPSYPKNSKNRRRKGDVVEKNLPPSPPPSEDEDEDGEENDNKELVNGVEKLSISEKKKKRLEKKAARKAERQNVKKKFRRPEKETTSESDSDRDEVDDDINTNNVCDKVATVPDASESESESSESDDEEQEILKTEEERQDFNKEVLQPLVYQADQFDNKTLGDLLKNFISLDILEGDNRYLCEWCSKKKGSKAYSTKAIKGQLIAFPPQTLIVQLKRFEALGVLGSRARNMRKCNTRVEFPAKLNISPYTSRIYQSLAAFYEPEMRLLEDQESGTSLLDYNLFGVVVHMGDLGHGHYIAYVKVRANLQEKDGYKEYSRFLHLKTFFPDFEHVFYLWLKCKKEKNVICNGHSNKKNDSPSESEHSDGGDVEGENQNIRIISESSAISNGTAISDKKDDEKNEEDIGSESERTGSEDDDEDEDDDQHNRKTKIGKKKEDSCWFYCSDSEVRACSEEDVLHSCTGQYFMFYERAS